jgi:hypothetical protein
MQASNPALHVLVEVVLPVVCALGAEEHPATEGPDGVNGAQPVDLEGTASPCRRLHEGRRPLRTCLMTLKQGKRAATLADAVVDLCFFACDPP